MIPLLLAALLLLAPASAHISAQAPQSIPNVAVHKTAVDEDDLLRLFKELDTAIAQRDVTTAATLTRNLFPDRNSLRRVIADETVISAILDEQKRWSSGSQMEMVRLFKRRPEQDATNVYAATTEELVEYADGSVAFLEFPGGARRAARQGVLKPGVTFYEVLFCRPGQTTGTRYHLFYHDGSSWKMVGPVWRHLP